MLTQVLVLSGYFRGHALDAHILVRLLIGSLLEGLINMAGKDSSPISVGRSPNRSISPQGHLVPPPGGFSIGTVSYRLSPERS